MHFNVRRNWALPVFLTQTSQTINKFSVFNPAVVPPTKIVFLTLGDMDTDSKQAFGIKFGNDI